MHDIIKSCLGKDPFKGQSRPIDFNITEYKKLMYMASGSTLQLTCKKLPLIKLWYSFKLDMLDCFIMFRYTVNIFSKKCYIDDAMSVIWGGT